MCLFIKYSDINYIISILQLPYEECKAGSYPHNTVLRNGSEKLSNLPKVSQGWLWSQDFSLLYLLFSGHMDRKSLFSWQLSVMDSNLGNYLGICRKTYNQLRQSS